MESTRHAPAVAKSTVCDAPDAGATEMTDIEVIRQVLAMENKSSAHSFYAFIAAVGSLVVSVIGLYGVFQQQKSEFAANASRLQKIETQNDERAKGVEYRLTTIESRLMNLESKR